MGQDPGLLYLDTIELLSRRILCCEGFPVHGTMLAASLVSILQIPAAAPCYDNQSGFRHCPVFPGEQNSPALRTSESICGDRSRNVVVSGGWGQGNRQGKGTGALRSAGDVLGGGYPGAHMLQTACENAFSWTYDLHILFLYKKYT